MTRPAPTRRRSWSTTAAATLTLLIGLCAAPALAQRGPLRGLDRELLKDSPSLLKLGGEVARDAAESTVRVLVDGEPAVLGTVVSADGLVLTKASELRQSGVEVRAGDGRVAAARIVGVAQENDLALLSTELRGLRPARFDGGASSGATAGAWIFSPAPGRDDLAEASDVMSVGNVGVAGLRRIPATTGLLGVSPGPATSGIPVGEVIPGGAADVAGLAEGDLILALDGRPVGTLRQFVQSLRWAGPDEVFNLTLSRGGQRREASVRLIDGRLDVELIQEATGVPIQRVSPDSGAEAAGLRAGDVILRFDGTPIRTPELLFKAVAAVSPGTPVEVEYLRQGRVETTTATIGYKSNRSLRGDLQNNFGTDLSARAVDFPAVLQHDSTLNADEMGGPVVDLGGRVLGINIARAGRTETYAIPSQVIAEVLPALRSGRMPTTTAPARDESGRPAEQSGLRGD